MARWLGWLYTGGYSTWDTRTLDVNERPPNSAKENAPEAAFLNHARRLVLAEVMLLRKLSDLTLYKLHNILDRRMDISNPAWLINELIPTIKYVHSSIGYAWPR